MLKEMFMKKMSGKKQLDPMEKEAKLGVAKELSKQAGAMLGDRAKPKAKVEVAADSEEGLKAGLDKAEDILEGKPNSMEGDDGRPEACEVSPEEADLSPEDLDYKIQKLMDLKASKEEPKEDSGNPFA